MEELPYRAEYAKSGRSSCKTCKSSIAKGELRLAVMVQSPVFDGKMPMWHHLNCFFMRQKPKTADDIAHLDSLRWEDQQSITKKIASPGAVLAASASGSTKKPTKKAVKSALKDFTIQYAKSSRAMCRGCEVKISKGTVRIAKKDYESDTAKYIGGEDRWYHLECFVKLRNQLEFFESVDNVNGFGSLTAEDKKMAKEALPKINPPPSMQLKDEVDGPTPSKRVKFEKETPQSDEEVKKKQNEKMFWYRDSLKQLNQKELTKLLEYNVQEDAVGPERKLDRLSDAMTFGALKPCQVCKNGQLVFRTGFGYQCIGDINEWTKCTNVVLEPERAPFKVPQDLREKYAFLDNYKGQVQKRLYTLRRSSGQSMTVDASGTPVIVDRFAPLKDLTFFFVGKTIKTKPELKKQIEDWGGSVSSKLTANVVAVIASKADPTTNNKIEEARTLNIHVVPETYLDEVGKGGNAVEKITEMSISSWGGDPKVVVQAARQKSQIKKSMKSRFDLKSASKVTLKVKGGSAVDPDSHLEDEAHVYSLGKDVWNAVLGLTDIQNNRNSFYKLQLLESDKGKRYWVFRSWGRIGTTIGGHKLDNMDSLEDAKKAFKLHYHERTNNKWDKRHNFVKYPGCMYPIDVDYGESTISLDRNSSIPSKLVKPVQDLVAMLFDVNTMKKVMLEFELDTEKMPLGKLSKAQIQKAYSVLSDLLQKTSEDIKPHAVIEATNRFYTLIPHSFGTQAVPSLDNIEIIRAKLEMLESLMEMEVAYSLLRETKDEGDSETNPLDAHYAKLSTDIDVLDRTSEEFKLIEVYVKNTHGKTHSAYNLEIEEVFKIRRNGEDKRFKPFKKLHNRKLLWHGSRTTNYAGILSQGLRIAPPEAPVTGYMFGKGIYFADMVSKSANYCMTSPGNPVGLLLLCEVALGDMYERYNADYITKLPAGKHSTVGLGANFPDPAESKMLEDGVEIPLGRTKSRNTQGSLLYNEYIVYDVAQVKARYLLKTKFVYKGYK